MNDAAFARSTIYLIVQRIVLIYAANCIAVKIKASVDLSRPVCNTMIFYKCINLRFKVFILCFCIDILCMH